MTRSAAPKLRAYTALTAVGLLAALVLGRPELVALIAPFALVLAAGLATAPAPRVAVDLELSRDRVVEGEETDLTIRLRSGRPLPHVEAVITIPDGLEVVDGANPFGLTLDDVEERTLRLACRRWGAHDLGRVHLRARDRFGLLVWEGVDRRALPLRVYPAEEHLRRLLAPLETQPFAGNQVARAKGDGIEFADVRQFGPGDRVKRINWRASARRNQLWVNESHPERNTDVILFLDTFAAAAGPSGSTLELAVRATASLASHYVERRDRVGLISYGGVFRWLVPGSGLRQMYTVVDALLDTEIILSYAWKDIDVIPRRVLPPQALVIALTPLLDARAVGALLDLRARGFDLVVVDVSPVPFTPPRAGEVEALARRLWLLKREALRARYTEAGVAIAEWRAGEPFQSPLEEVRQYRRYATTGRA